MRRAAISALAAPAALALALTACAPRSTAEGFQPRRTRGVILVSLDTLRADHRGCYGYPLPTSPFLDSLAARGTLFTRHVVQIPATLTSHMSIFTGLYPGEHGVYPPVQVLSPEIPTLPEVFRDHGFRTSGHTEGGWMNGGFGFARGFEDWSDEPYAADTDVARTLDRGLAFLRGLGDGERFFLFLHTYSIHDPYRPPEEFRRMFWPGEPPAGVPEPTGENLVAANQGKLALPPAALDYYRALYDASIRYVDSELERFFAGLERLGLAGQVTVMITSDHGEEFREHGKLAHTQVYFENLHAPLLVLNPGQKVATRVDTVTQTVDLAPTLYELAGIAGPPVSGESLVPRLKRAALPSRERGFSEAEIFWGVSKSIVEADEGRLDQLVFFGRELGINGFWSTGEIRFESFASRLEFQAVTLAEPRRVEVLAGGRPVATLTMPPRWQSYAVDLPGREGEKRDVVMRSSTCTVPKDIGFADDTRCLSFKLKGMPLDRFELFDLARDPLAQHDRSFADAGRARALLRALAEYRHRSAHPVGKRELSESQIRELKALGYLQ